MTRKIISISGFEEKDVQLFLELQEKAHFPTLSSFLKHIIISYLEKGEPKKN